MGKLGWWAIITIIVAVSFIAYVVFATEPIDDSPLYERCIAEVQKPKAQWDPGLIATCDEQFLYGGPPMGPYSTP